MEGLGYKWQWNHIQHTVRFQRPEHFKLKLVLLTGHVICHVTFSGRKQLFEELVAVLVISSRENAFQMQVNYFHPLTFGMTVPLFTEKFYRVKGRLFKRNLTFDHLYLLKTKSRKIISNVAKWIISICIENAHLLINRPKIRHQFADLLKFNKTIT